MTKAELIEGLANKLNLNKADAEKAVNLLLDDIVAALKQGDRVNISGFGTVVNSLNYGLATGAAGMRTVSATVRLRFCGKRARQEGCLDRGISQIGGG